MVVYVELVFIENFIVDYFLLKAVEYFCLKKQKHILLSSSFGAVYSCIAPISKICLNPIIKFCVLGAMLFICFGKLNLKEYVWQLIYAIMCSCALYGIVSIITLSGGNLFKHSDKILYSDDYVFIIACICSFFAVVAYYLIKFMAKRHKLKQVSATLILNDRKLNAVIDSGNSLYYKGKPVVVVSKKAAKIEDKIPLIIPYSCLKGEGALLGYEDSLTLTVNEKDIEVNCIIAVSDKESFSGFDALIHPELVRGCV